MTKGPSQAGASLCGWLGVVDPVQNVKMKEELTIHEDLCSALEMFNLANKCARAKDGRLSLLELPEADREDKKAKAKEVKRKVSHP